MVLQYTYMNKKISEMDADHLSFVRTGIGYVTGMSPAEFEQWRISFESAPVDASVLQERERALDFYRRRGRELLEAAGVDQPADYFAEEPLSHELLEASESRLPHHVQEMLFQLGITPQKTIDIIENLPVSLSSGAALRDEL